MVLIVLVKLKIYQKGGYRRRIFASQFKLYTAFHIHSFHLCVIGRVQKNLSIFNTNQNHEFVN